MMPIEFATVEEAVEELRQGRQIVLVDDEDRENEGDLALVGGENHAGSDQFHGQVRPRADLPGADRGPLRRIAPAADVADQYLGARDGVHANRSTRGAERPPASARPTAPPRFSPPSTRLRARRTWRGPATFSRCARKRGGVLVRAGQTEASVDLARIAGLYPAGVICEIMDDDGTMARLPQLAEFCRGTDMKLLTVAELIRYRMRHERYVRRVAEGVLPTRYGDFRMIVLRQRRGPRAAHRAGARKS